MLMVRMGECLPGLSCGLMLVGLGCGSPSPPPPSVGIGDHPGTTGSSGTPDGGSPGGFDATTGGEGGTASYVCSEPTAGLCFSYTNLGSDTLTTLESACTTTNGSEVSACSTTSLVGCCTTQVGYTQEECYYATAGFVGTTQSSQCTGLGGVFTALP